MCEKSIAEIIKFLFLEYRSQHIEKLEVLTIRSKMANGQRMMREGEGVVAHA